MAHSIPMYPVSVIVPIFNVQPFLYACLDSLRQQTLRPIEVLLIDNASTDASPAMAEEYIRRHSLQRDWHIIHSDVNHGPGHARNIGLQAATGHYVAFVDGDDWIEPDMLAFLYDAAIQAPCGICDISSSAAVKEYPDRQGERMFNPKIGTGEVTPKQRSFLLKHYASNFTTMLYLRSWLNDADIRFPECRSAEDSAFVGMCYLQVRRIAQCDVPFYHYRIHSHSISHRKDLRRATERKQAMQELIRYASSHNLYATYRFPLWFVYLKKAILTSILH